MNRKKAAAGKRAMGKRTQERRVKLTARDTRLVIELLENPPAPNAKLRKSWPACSLEVVNIAVA